MFNAKAEYPPNAVFVPLTLSNTTVIVLPLAPMECSSMELHALAALLIARNVAPLPCAQLVAPTLYYSKELVKINALKDSQQ